MRLAAYKINIAEILKGKYVKTPGEMEPNYLVLEDNRRIDICVLSPSSAIAITISGMNKSSIILIPTLFHIF